MTVTDWIQAFAMVLLVMVTIFYALQARRTVREMRLQRLEAKPFVVPDIDVHSPHRSYVENMKDIAQGIFPVVLTNVGTASAVELELLLKVPDNDFISTKLPLLLPGADWRDRLAYVSEFTEEGEPCFGLPPPQGLYELKVTFRSATSPPDSHFSEVTLPVDLHWSGKSFWWQIKKHQLQQKLPNTWELSEES